MIHFLGLILTFWHLDDNRSGLKDHVSWIAASRWNTTIFENRVAILKVFCFILLTISKYKMWVNYSTKSVICYYSKHIICYLWSYLPSNIDLKYEKFIKYFAANFEFFENYIEEMVWYFPCCFHCNLQEKQIIIIAAPPHRLFTFI